MSDLKFTHSPQQFDAGDNPRWYVDLTDGMMKRAQYEAGMGEHLTTEVMSLYGDYRSSDLFEWYDELRGVE